MRQSIVWSLRFFLAVIVVLTPLVAAGQDEKPPAGSKAAIAIAKRYLFSIEASESLSPDGDKGQDVVYVGYTRPPAFKWKIVVVADGENPRLVSVSPPFADRYFQVFSPDGIGIGKDGQGFIVSLQGCVAHECPSRQGYGLYVSSAHRFFWAHVDTRSLSEDPVSYQVTYYPQAGVPARYRQKLNEQICSDDGARIIQPFVLSIKCPAQ